MYALDSVNGKFYIGNKEHNLNSNELPNHLHGGAVGFNKKIWQIFIKYRFKMKEFIIFIKIK